MRSPVPDTLAGVLQARLDALTRDELAAAQRASVIGHLFWSEGVAALGGRPEAIDGLVARALVVAKPHSSLPAQHEFAFRHHLLHQFVYDSLLKPARRSHHGAAATWLAATTTGSLDHLAVIAEHHERADGDADLLVGSLDGPDRLLVNDGSGALTMHSDVFFALSSGGTLGMAVADLNGTFDRTSSRATARYQDTKTSASIWQPTSCRPILPHRSSAGSSSQDRSWHEITTTGRVNQRVRKGNSSSAVFVLERD